MKYINLIEKKIDNPFDLLLEGYTQEELVTDVLNKKTISKKVLRLVADRSIDQRIFRQVLLKAYSWKCCICELAVEENFRKHRIHFSTAELVQHTHTAGCALTPEQIAEIREAEKYPIVFDGDCPELTDEQLAEFQPVHFASWEERNRVMHEAQNAKNQTPEPLPAAVGSKHAEVSQKGDTVTGNTYPRAKLDPQISRAMLYDCFYILVGIIFPFPIPCPSDKVYPI